MTLDDIENTLKAKEPRLHDPAHEVVFTSGALFRLLAQVYNEGRKAEMRSKPAAPMYNNDAITRMFGGIFK